MPHQPVDLGPALLFCPGDRPERFAKAAAAADTTVLDLEDGVAPDAKDAARSAVMQYIGQSPDQIVVRINHPTTQRGRDDAAAAIAAGCRTLLLPKTESRAELEQIAPSDGTVQLVATIETARGILALPEILAHPSVAAVSWGPYDLAADMGLRFVRDAEQRLLPPLAQARNHLLICTAAARKLAFDTVTTELRDPAVLARDAGEAAILGFAGKFSIHPAQIGPIRQAFRPGAEEIDRCHRLLAAIPKHGAFLFEGEMIDEPILRRARRTLDIAARINAP